MKNNSISSEYTKEDVGCYVDSARGIYMGEQIQRIAKSHGWPDTPEFCGSDKYGIAVEGAEEFMDANYSVDGCHWGHNESGDWGLWENLNDE